MYKFYYDDSAGIIMLENEKGHRDVVAESFSSEPKLSPNGREIVYITPLEWEVESELILLDLTTGNRSELELDINKDTEKVKDVLWVDDSNLILIIGMLHGTVGVGGDIYRYNIKDKTLVKIVDCQSHKKQAIKLQLEGDTIYYNIIEYVDDMLNQHIFKKESISLYSAF